MGEHAAAHAPAAATVGSISPPGLWDWCRTHAMRWLKATLGAAVLVYAASTLLNAFVLPVSSEAVVAGRVTTLRAPIDGILELKDVDLGTSVQASRELAVITNPWADDSLVLELKNRILVADAELSALEPQDAALDELARGLERGASLYQLNRVRQLGALLAESRASLEGSRAEAALGEERHQRANAMFQQGVLAEEALAQAVRDRTVAAQRLEAGQKSIEALENQKRAAQAGVNIDASGMGADRPYSRQRLDEVTLERIRVAERIATQTRLREAMKTQLVTAEARLQRFSSTTLTAPRPGRLWKLFAATQAYVNRGQPLLSVINCDSALVVATVKERIFRKLSVGSPVTFELDGKSLPGRVLRVEGLGRPSEEDVVVAPGLMGQRDPIPTSADPYRVTLSIPALRAPPYQECLIGRTGTVTFE